MSYLFLGAAVKDFSNQIGWNIGSPSTLSIRLVDDIVNGNIYNPPSVGTPVAFNFGGLNFEGLLQKTEKKRSISGNPEYEATISDPREILEGAQVITSSYNGSVNGIKNIFNAYGYWESVAGYGGSQVNEGGMPWILVKNAILAICNNPTYGLYGGPLTFRGIKYSLDLSELPAPPAYYRVGGAISIGLLELISQICEDGGCDFHVQLSGFTIRIKTVSRLNPPPLGTIATILNSGGNSRTSDGLELRNELTSAMLIGGDVTSLNATSSIAQFWGYNILGSPIIGYSKTFIFREIKTGNVLDTFTCEEAPLNSAPISDIIGSVVYRCSTLEMRFAQVNMESWENFIRVQRPDIAAISGISSVFLNKGNPLSSPVKGDLTNTSKQHAINMASNAILGDLNSKRIRFYEFVKGYADEYMGKKFLVSLPFLLSAVDSETLKVNTSYEITDGGYLPEGSAPLGLSELNQDLFKTQDGRFRAFCLYSSNLSTVDFSKVSPQNSIIDTGGFYCDVHVDPKIIFIPTPACVVSVSGQLHDKAVDNLGDSGLVSKACLQKKPAEGQAILKNVSCSLKISPLTRIPDYIAIPLKSNTSTYGPWLASTTPGKVRIEHDSSLTPWNYGSYDAMNRAGNIRVVNSITNMQVSETGSIEKPGAPTVSLGDILQAGGPNITAIDVQVGPNGVTTNYRFQTFTPRFGVFSKGYIERLRRISLANQELKKEIRNAIKQTISTESAIFSAIRTQKAYQEKLAKAQKRETPHDVFQSYCTIDQDTGHNRCDLLTCTLEESITMSNADNDSEYVKTAIMGYNGLFRPFSVTNAISSGIFPAYTIPSVSGNIPNKTNLDPWGKGSGNDIEMYTYGSVYSDIHAYRQNDNGSQARVFGLRAPIVLVGWGYDTDGNCIPGTGNVWNSDVNNRFDKWAVGPLDPLFDKRRGVWTVHDMYKGTIDVTITGNGSGTMTVLAGDGSTWPLNVYNFFNTDISVSGGGTLKVMANYIATDNKYYIVAADCS